MPDTDWIDSMDEDNLLAIFDVSLDIEKELNIKSDPIFIPMMPQLIRFRRLFPGDSIGMRDRYMEIRWKALEFLHKVGILTEVEWVDSGSHRWESRVKIVTDEKLFRVSLAKMKQKFEPKSAVAKSPKADESEG